MRKEQRALCSASVHVTVRLPRRPRAHACVRALWWCAHTPASADASAPCAALRVCNGALCTRARPTWDRELRALCFAFLLAARPCGVRFGAMKLHIELEIAPDEVALATELMATLRCAIVALRLRLRPPPHARVHPPLHAPLMLAPRLITASCGGTLAVAPPGQPAAPKEPKDMLKALVARLPAEAGNSTTVRCVGVGSWWPEIVGHAPPCSARARAHLPLSGLAPPHAPRRWSAALSASWIATSRAAKACPTLWRRLRRRRLMRGTWTRSSPWCVGRMPDAGPRGV